MSAWVVEEVFRLLVVVSKLHMATTLCCIAVTRLAPLFRVERFGLAGFLSWVGTAA